MELKYLVLGLFFIILAIFSSASTEISDCGIINASGIYILNQTPPSTPPSECFDIQASDVVIDCNGNMITGGANDVVFIDNSYPESYNISNITVQNCFITDTNNGLRIVGNAVNDVTFQNNYLNISGNGVHQENGVSDTLASNYYIFNNTFNQTVVAFYNNDFQRANNVTLNSNKYYDCANGGTVFTDSVNVNLINESYYSATVGCGGIGFTNASIGTMEIIDDSNGNVTENFNVYLIFNVTYANGTGVDSAYGELNQTYLNISLWTNYVDSNGFSPPLSIGTGYNSSAINWTSNPMIYTFVKDNYTASGSFWLNNDVGTEIKHIIMTEPTPTSTPTPSAYTPQFVVGDITGLVTSIIGGTMQIWIGLAMLIGIIILYAYMTNKDKTVW